MILLLVLMVSVALTWWMAFGKGMFAIMDHPNERSLHARPIPRSGGVAILLAIAVGWGGLIVEYGVSMPLLWIAVAALMVATVSLLDDLFELPARARLPVHVLAGVLILLSGIALPWGWLGWMISLFGIVWMLNLYNFMDGMDGFAGGMTLAGFAFLGIGGYLAGNLFYAWLCWTVVVAALGFLFLNFPPARIFMGDVGSATLGVLAAGMSLWGIAGARFPIWFPLLVFSPFWVDATVTLIWRALRREKVWQAHRTHYYQRLVRAGWGHRKTVLVEYGLMLASGASALVLLVYPERWIVGLGLLVWLVIYIILASMVNMFCAGKELQ